MELKTYISIQEKVKQIEEMYQNLHIYKSLIVYDDPAEWYEIKSSMERLDFSFGKDGRIYELGPEGDYSNIEWDTISLIICLGDVAKEKGEVLASRYAMKNCVIAKI